MVTLKDLVEEQKCTEESDMELIRKFFVANNLEEEEMDLITELSKEKVSKLKRKHKFVEDWATMLPSTYLYKTYDLEIADKLHMMELDYLVNGGSLSNNLLEWAKEYLPSIERPSAYFNPLVDWLENKGVYFKKK